MNPTLTKVLAGLVLFISGAVMGFFGSRLLTERGTLALLHGDSHRFVDMAMPSGHIKKDFPAGCVVVTVDPLPCSINKVARCCGSP